MKIFEKNVGKKDLYCVSFFGECQLKVLIVKKKYVWGSKNLFCLGGR